MASSAGDMPEVKFKRTGSLGSSDYVRADKIDLTSLDIQLEQQLNKKWGKTNIKSQGPKADWEIDLAKLEIRHVIAQGTYGTVYRGTYDGQQVAGIYLNRLKNMNSCCLIVLYICMLLCPLMYSSGRITHMIIL
ncbi:unnamed protein product [Triticum turgidum subsp. durum]|uniref:Uncharacterized protein n=1 Tax=Triticum turgidum subsp. durum TaxID=4567 RepID=A0A9R0TXD0_TRITD|nr:unnamed protein product [Triticum turgidum subsp. durum]